MTEEQRAEAQSADATETNGTAETNGAGETTETTETAASEAKTGRALGAEARELERQLEEARQQLRQAEERARENLDRWQRAQADLANYRRRTQFEREEHEKYAVASLTAALLPVLDSFDRAWQSLPGQLRRLTWLSGVAMINSQLRGTLERIGLTEIEAEGQPFDPALHEAVDSDPADGPPHVVAVLQAGYKLHERVLRPALVKVGPAPAAGAAAAGGGEPAAEAPAGQDGEAPDAGASGEAAAAGEAGA